MAKSVLAALKNLVHIRFSMFQRQHFTAETPGHLIRNKIAGKLENTSAQNASETNTFLQTEDV